MARDRHRKQTIEPTRWCPGESLAGGCCDTLEFDLNASNSPTGLRAVLASFSIRSFRYQWSADVLSTWGFEMETLILGWYILVETDSAILLASVGALRFGGTLLSPMVGVMADRIARRKLMVWMRCVLSLLAVVIIVADEGGFLGPRSGDAHRGLLGPDSTR